MFLSNSDWFGRIYSSSDTNIVTGTLQTPSFEYGSTFYQVVDTSIDIGTTQSYGSTLSPATDTKIDTGTIQPSSEHNWFLANLILFNILVSKIYSQIVQHWIWAAVCMQSRTLTWTPRRMLSHRKQVFIIFKTKCINSNTIMYTFIINWRI